MTVVIMINEHISQNNEMSKYSTIIFPSREPHKPPVCNASELSDNTEALFESGVFILIRIPSGILETPSEI